VALIMYTSGSTGTPKGVVLTHRNFVCTIAGMLAQGGIVKESDNVIAYLPLAHILELIVETTTLSRGGCIAYAHPRSLTETSPYIRRGDTTSPDLTTARPTLMAAVPAILDLITNGLKAKALTSGLVAKLLNGAIDRRRGVHDPERLASAGCGCCACLDNKLLGKLRTKMGLDRVRMMISGGAPLSAETQQFVSAVFAPVAQGYGATETTACCTVQEVMGDNGRPADPKTGRVGAIVPTCEVKLLSVPDMGYNVTDEQPRGEILIAGNNVSQAGYFQMPDKSDEDFPTHADGKKWFHTGDVGVMHPDGVLQIIDRKKDLIKLSGGEYVSLGKVEAAMKGVKGISQCCVFAQSDKDHCVAIVSQPEKGWASVGGKPEDEVELQKAVAAELKGLKFANFEIPKIVKIHDEVWTTDSGLVTAAFKLQRNPLREYYNTKGNLLEKMDYTFAQK